MKYPYIGKGLNSGSIVLFYEQNKGVTLESKTWASENLQHSNCINEDLFKNITDDYLRNTYGKVESKEHAEFIVKLAESAGFKQCHNSSVGNAESFMFYSDGEFGIYDKAHNELVNLQDRKLITLPLPPKEKPMESQKEWPAVGDEVLICKNVNLLELHRFNGKQCKVIGVCEHDDIKVLTLSHKSCGLAAMNMGEWIIKPPTPEEELRDALLNYAKSDNCSYEWEGFAKSIINGEIKGLSYKPE